MKRNFVFGFLLLFIFSFVAGITAQVYAGAAPVPEADPEPYGYGCCIKPATGGCSAGAGWFHKYYGGWWTCHTTPPPAELVELVGDCPIITPVCR